MKNYKGAVFFDYDGTLTDVTEGIYKPTQITKESIEKLKENGYFTCLCTGRGKSYAPFNEANFDGIITSNGAYIEKDGKCLYSTTFPEELVNEVIEYATKNNIYYFAETQEVCYTDDLDKKIFSDMLEHFKVKTSYKPVKDMDRSNIYKFICAYENEDVYRQLKKEFEGKMAVDAHGSFLSCDISVLSVTKGTGIGKVIEMLNIPFENTFAFGDGENDIGMFKAVCHPIALKVCHKELRKLAEYITDTVKNEGVYKALVHYGLIS